ncbi:MAG: polysaccharide deacetylase family protein [Firmicutes bacterium]|nr:polysaccharide deacetylase family protein [Bacillota bacterium]
MHPVAAAGIGLLVIAVLLFMGWMGLADLWHHRLRRGVVVCGPARHEVALTFDDGPDPRYTPLLLDLLHEKQVPATFFLVSRRAQEQRVLVQRMMHEGHAIGCHSETHRHAWLLGPRATYRQVIDAGDHLQQIAGRPIRYFRPPWGMFNARTYRLARHRYEHVVLWNVEVRDWAERRTAEAIAQDLLRQVTDGAIVDLHDAGGAEEAPLRTIRALSEVLDTLRAEGYRFVTLDHWFAASDRGSIGGKF